MRKNSVLSGCVICFEVRMPRKSQQLDSAYYSGFVGKEKKWSWGKFAIYGFRIPAVLCKSMSKIMTTLPSKNNLFINQGY